MQFFSRLWKLFSDYPLNLLNLLYKKHYEKDLVLSWSSIKTKSNCITELNYYFFNIYECCMIFNDTISHKVLLKWNYTDQPCLLVEKKKKKKKKKKNQQEISADISTRNPAEYLQNTCNKFLLTFRRPEDSAEILAENILCLCNKN